AMARRSRSMLGSLLDAPAVREAAAALLDAVAEEADGGASAPASRARRPRSGPVAGQAGEVTSPLPGNILKVLVKEGDLVKPDTVVCVLEAMKMETQVQANQAGEVAEVLIRPGDKVEGGQTLVRLEQD
ncbi:MAG: acetyl-CoA carboxylase biotin carboxyl carrier protein subunit, partial [Nitrospinota bacterium]|nr:acetyl-CoA carboxylase biotin carboxyl carrier protein subunit [Nitrospinota bacterium]